MGWEDPEIVTEQNPDYWSQVPDRPDWSPHIPSTPTAPPPPQIDISRLATDPNLIRFHDDAPGEAEDGVASSIAHDRLNEGEAHTDSTRMTTQPFMEGLEDPALHIDRNSFAIIPNIEGTPVGITIYAHLDQQVVPIRVVFDRIRKQVPKDEGHSLGIESNLAEVTLNLERDRFPPID